MAIIYEVGFKADSKSLQSQLQSIGKDIDAAFSRGTGVLKENISEGIRQATILETVLKRATTDKGTSFINMNVALKQAGSSVQDMIAGLSGAKMNGALNTFLKTFAQADRNLIGISSKIQEMQRVMTQSIKFNMAMAVQNFVSGQIQAAIAYVQDLNKAITDIITVAPELAGRIEEVSETIILNAQNLRIAAKEYAEAALIFYQQGLDSDEVARRTEVTVKAALASGQSMKDMAEQLTAVWNTYQMIGEEMDRAASIAARLGAETAAEFKDIAVGMQIAASGASMLGVSYESLAAIMSTVTETTKQSASTIGNAYKTIFARFTNLTAAGEEGEVELGRIAQQLSDLGIRVLDADGNLRDLDGVINQLGNSWDNYSRKQQIAIAQVVGGVRQYQQFLALMQNFDKYQKNLASAQSERGTESLDRQYLTALSSIDRQMQMSSDAWKRALSGVFDTKSQMAFYGSLEKIGNVVEDIVDNLGGMKGILMLVGAFLLREVVPAVTKIKNTLVELWNNRNVDAQIKNIEKTLNLSIKQMDKLSGFTGVQRGTEGFKGGSEGVAADANYYEKEKVQLAAQIAEANARLNKIKQDGSEIDRQEAENLQRQLTKHQELYNAALDILQAKQQTFAAEEKEHARAEQRLNSLKTKTAQQNAEKVKSAKDELQKQEAILAAMEKKTKAQKQAYAEQQKVVKKAQEELKAAEDAETKSKSSIKNKERELAIVRQISAIGKEQASILNPEEEAEAVEKVKAGIEALKTSLGSLSDISLEEESIISALIEELDENTDINVQLEAIASGLAAINEERENADGNPLVSEEDIQNIRDTAAASSQLSVSQDQVNQRVAESRTIWQASGVSMNEFVKDAGKMVSSVAMGIIMVTNTIDNLSQKAKEGSLSFGDIAQAALMLTPMLASMGASIYTVAGHLAKMALATNASTGASMIDTVAKGLQAAGILSVGAAATVAAVPVGVLTVIIMGAILAIVAIIAIFVALSNATKAAREETVKQAAAHVEAANKANELRDSLVELRNSLYDLNTKMQEGTLTTEEFSDAMAELRQRVRELKDENPDLNLTLTGDIEGDLNRVNAAIREANATAIAEAKEAQRKVAELNKIDVGNAGTLDYIWGIVSPLGGGINLLAKQLTKQQTEGTAQFATGFRQSETESIQKAMDRVGIESQGKYEAGWFRGASGTYDLVEIAENYTTILRDLGGATSELGQKFDAEMRKVDGFVELLGSVEALEIAKSFEEYERVLEKTPEDLAAYFDEANKKKKEALLKDEELKRAQEELTEAQLKFGKTGSDIDRAAMKSAEKRIKSLEAEADQAHATAAEYDNMMQFMYSDTSEKAQSIVRREQATELLRGRKAQELRAEGETDEARIIELSFDLDQASVDRAVALMEAGYEDLIGMEDTRKWAITQTGLALNGLSEAFAKWNEEATTEDKIQAFEDINAQIDIMNERIRGVPELDIKGVEGIEEIPKLTESFFELSAAEREVIIASQELQAAHNKTILNAADLVLANEEVAKAQAKLAAETNPEKRAMKEADLQAKLEAANKLRIEGLLLEQEETKKLNDRIQELSKSIDELSASSFSGTAEEQAAMLDDVNIKIREYNQRIEELGGAEQVLPELGQGFLLLSDAEKEVTLQLNRTLMAMNESEIAAREYQQALEDQQKLKESIANIPLDEREDRLAEAAEAVARAYDKQEVAARRALQTQIELLKKANEEIIDQVHNFGEVQRMIEKANFDKVTQSYILTAEQVKEIGDLYPEVLAKATVAADGQVRLSKMEYEAFKQQKELTLLGEAETQAQMIQMSIILLQAKVKALQAEKDMAVAMAKGDYEAFVEAQGIKAQADAELAAIQTENAFTVEEVMAQVANNNAINMGTSSEEIATDSTKAANSIEEDYTNVDTTVAQVATDTGTNMGKAAAHAANKTSESASKQINSWAAVWDAVKNVWKAIVAAVTGNKNASLGNRPGGGGAGGINGAFTDVMSTVADNVKPVGVSGTGNEIALEESARGSMSDIKTRADFDAAIKDSAATYDKVAANIQAEIDKTNAAIGQMIALQSDLAAHGAADLANWKDQTPGKRDDHSDEDKGGGGKEAEQRAKKRDLADRKEIENLGVIYERYENINKAIEDQNVLLGKTSKAADHAYGTAKVALLNKQTSILEKQGILYQNLIKETEYWTKVDKDRLNTLLAQQNLPQMQFSEDPGELLMQLSTVRGQLDEMARNAEAEAKATVTSLADAYDAAIQGTTDEEAKKLKELYDEGIDLAQAKLDLVADYIKETNEAIGATEENAKKLVEDISAATDLIYEWLNKRIAAITEIRDLRVAIKDTDLQIMDLAMRRLGKSAENVEKRLSNITSEFSKMGEKVVEVASAVNDLNDLVEELNSLDQTQFIAQYGEKAWAQFKASGEIPKEIMDKLEAYQQQLIDLQNSYFDKYEEMWDEYLSALQEFSERFDTITSHLDNNLTLLTSLTTIWEKSGKQYGDSATSLKLLATQADTAANKVESLKAKWDIFQKVANQAQADYEWAQRQGFDEITMEGFKNAMESATQIAEDAHVAFVSGVADYLDQIAELEAANAAMIYRTWSESLGGLFADLDNAMNMYNQKKAIDDYFLTEVNKQYKLDSIIRAITEDMENMTDTEGLEKFQEMMDKLNQRKEDGIGLTETQAEILQKEYELLKARYALEDAQAAKEAAKQTMRLARDASGNWSYVYSADSKDQAKVDDMTQKIADLENQIYNLHRTAADEGSEAWLQLQQSYADYLANIDWTRYEHDVAYKEQVDQTINWYKEQSALFANTITEHNAAIDRSFSDTTLGVITNLETMEHAEDWYSRHHTDLKDQLLTNHDQWQAKAKETQENVGLNYENLSQIIDAKTEEIIADNVRTMTNLQELQSTADRVIEDMQSQVRQMAQTWNNEIRSMMDMIDQLIRKIQELRYEQAGTNQAGDDMRFNWQTDYTQTLLDAAESGKITKEYVEQQAAERWAKIVTARQLVERANNGETINWEREAGGLSESKVRSIAAEWSQDLGSQSQQEYIKQYLAKYNFDTGGMTTGPMVAGLSMDGKKEIVLNNSDTENFLAAIQIMRDSIQAHLSSLGMKQAAVINSSHRAVSEITETQTPVIIQADFPNVSAREEIEAAFENLVNRAAQYQLKPKD